MVLSSHGCHDKLAQFCLSGGKLCVVVTLHAFVGQCDIWVPAVGTPDMPADYRPDTT